jgi:hypothetical protein
MAPDLVAATIDGVLRRPKIESLEIVSPFA